MPLAIVFKLRLDFDELSLKPLAVVLGEVRLPEVLLHLIFLSFVFSHVVVVLLVELLLGKVLRLV